MRKLVDWDEGRYDRAMRTREQLAISCWCPRFAVALLSGAALAVLSCGGPSGIAGTVIFSETPDLPAGSILTITITDADGHVARTQSTGIRSSPPLPFHTSLPHELDEAVGKTLFARAEVLDPHEHPLWRSDAPAPLESKDQRDLALSVAPIVSTASASWNCSGRVLVAVFSTGVVDLQELGSQDTSPASLRLWRVISGSGARYSNGADELWIKGSEATLRVGGETVSCVSATG